MDPRPIIAVILLLLLMPTFDVGAEQPSLNEDFSLDWTHDFGEVYITTAPLFVGEQLFVRTSASWGGSDTPSVTAFTLAGEPLWSHANPSSSHHDMAPMMHVEQGNGACGAWPDMLLIGWSDGRIEARAPSDGALLWSHQTEAVTWGITGSMAVDEDHIVVPTRTGLVALCASDGHVMVEATTGLGWRNGVTVGVDGYFLGDEKGTLWAVSRDGSVRSQSLEAGKIRHAPLITSAGLFVQVQKDASSTAHVVDPTTLTSNQTLDLGPSVAIPLGFESYILSADSTAVRLFECLETCQFLSSSTFRSNGEIGRVHDGLFMLPYNGPDSGWGIVNVSNPGEVSVETVFTGADGYATSGPGFGASDGQQHLAFGSDEGVVYVHVAAVDEPALSKVVEEGDEPATPDFAWGAQGVIFLLYIALAGAAVQMFRNRGTSVLKFLSLYVLLIALLVVDQVAVQWSQYVNEVNPAPTEEVWDPSWDESWRGTQIVSIVIDGEMLAIGGLEGHDNALDLTMAACQELGLEVRTEATGMGTYVVAFNEVTGEGWEYTVDGRFASVAADFTVTDASSIVQWHPVEVR